MTVKRAGAPGPHGDVPDAPDGRSSATGAGRHAGGAGAMTSAAVLGLYRRCGALREGHFKLSSGLHSPCYFQSALVLARPRDAQRLGTALARRFDRTQVDVVLGPALGAIVVAHVVGYALGRRAIFAERVAGRMALRRGFDLAEGERVLLVEDVLTTGGSMAELAVVVTLGGAQIVGRGCLVDRRSAAAAAEMHVTSLARIDAPTYGEDECPQCKEGLSLESPGSRRLVGR